ncbi:MAG: TatD family hydrolase [Verrucomicrobiota bacterium]|nr:TatD family hydrolase [Verrucomicrobiota bacterium]
MEIIETHAHLDYPEFDIDRDAVLQRASENHVKTLISIGTKLESSQRAVALAEKYPQVFAVVGWHPTDVDAAPDDVNPLLRPLALHPKVVAIGETGLDYHRLPSRELGGPSDDQSAATGEPNEVDLQKSKLDKRYKERQEILFRQQLELASGLGLNVVVHQRDAFDDCLRIMTEYAGKTRGVWHCFVNDPEHAKKVIAIGSSISFTGIITFKNAQTIVETVKATPLKSIMVETDCPYLAPVPFRGKRAEPWHTRLVVEKIAEIKGITPEEVARVTTENAHQFFKFNRTP